MCVCVCIFGISRILNIYMCVYIYIYNNKRKGIYENRKSESNLKYMVIQNVPIIPSQRQLIVYKYRISVYPFIKNIFARYRFNYI